MINILGDRRKRIIQMRRINSALLTYTFSLLLIIVLIIGIYAVGFWVVANEKQAIQEKIDVDKNQASSIAAVENKASSFRSNLSIAKRILSSETPYSSFLITLANDMPDGTIITNISLSSSPTPIETKEGLTLKARVVSYAKVLEAKTKLEESKLFEDVSIASVVRPDDIGSLVGQERKYPYDVSYKVRLSTNKATE